MSLTSRLVSSLFCSASLLVPALLVSFPSNSVVNMTATTQLLDVLILGGGPGGLAVATGLARQLYTAAVFDSGVYRNARTKHMHNVPTWDHRDPAEFRAQARTDLLARYSTVQFVDGTKIVSIAHNPQGLFLATAEDGRTWTGRKLVLASGVTDIGPDIKGYDECWARGIYHCLFCHGYEDRGVASAGVLAIGDMGNVGGALHMARMAKRLASKVTIYTHGASELSEQLVQSKGDDAAIQIDARRIVSLRKTNSTESEIELGFEDGKTSTEGFVAHKPKSQLSGPFAQQLKLELTEQGLIKTSPPFYESSVKGVFAVGDCATPMPSVTHALAMGAFAAAGAVTQLQVEPVPAGKI